MMAMAYASASLFYEFHPSYQPPADCDDPLRWAQRNLSYGVFVALGFYTVPPRAWKTKDGRNNWYQSRLSSDLEARSRAQEAGFREIQSNLRKLAMEIQVFVEKWERPAGVTSGKGAKAEEAIASTGVSTAAPQPQEAEEVAALEAADSVVEELENAADPDDVVFKPDQVAKVEKEDQGHIAVEADACPVLPQDRTPTGVHGQDGVTRMCEPASISVTKGATAFVVIVKGRRGNSIRGSRILDEIDVPISTDDYHCILKAGSTVLLKNRWGCAFKFCMGKQAQGLGVEGRPPAKPPPQDIILDATLEIRKVNSMPLSLGGQLCVQNFQTGGLILDGGSDANLVYAVINVSECFHGNLLTGLGLCDLSERLVLNISQGFGFLLIIWAATVMKGILFLLVILIIICQDQELRRKGREKSWYYMNYESVLTTALIGAHFGERMEQIPVILHYKALVVGASRWSY